MLLNGVIDQSYKINTVTKVLNPPPILGDEFDSCSEISDSNNFDSQLSQFSSSNFTTPTGNATTNQILNTATIPKRDFDLYYNMETHIQSLVDKLICKIAALKSKFTQRYF